MKVLMFYNAICFLSRFLPGRILSAIVKELA